nr:MAG TPA: hypothetical protein [Caudoviricetes sp.]
MQLCFSRSRHGHVVGSNSAELHHKCFFCVQRKVPA